MKNRLSTGIINRLLLLIFVYLFLVACFGYLASSFYVSYKNYNLMETIYAADNVDEIIQEANDNGFVVSILNSPTVPVLPEQILLVIDGYAVIKTPTSIELVGEEVIQFSINPNIIEDFSKLLMGFVIFTGIAFLVIVLVIYTYMQKRVIEPANEIVNLISNNESDYKFQFDDEFLIIKTELEIKNKRIQSELELKNEILKAITHELKTPLAKISTIIYLHKNNVEGYQSLEETEQVINEIISSNEELINKTLEHFNNNIADGVVTVQEEINSLIDENKDTNISIHPIYINDIEIQSNFLISKFVITNVMSNAFKYADSYIDIKVQGNKLTITNDYSKNISKKGNGLKIVNKLIENKKINLDISYTENVYEVVVTFN